MSKILIDARWLRPSLRGIGVFVRNLLIEIHKNADFKDFDVYIAAPKEAIIELKAMGMSQFKYIPIPKLADPLLDFIYFNLLNFKHHFNLVHFTGNSGFLVSKNTKVLLTLHDVSYFKASKIVPQPQRLRQKIGRIYRKLVIRFFVSNCSSIVTVSKFAMNDIKVEIPSIRSIDYVHHGFSEFIYEGNALTHKNNTYMVVGGDDPQKNILLAINAFNRLSEIRVDLNLQLVIVGVDEFKFIKKYPVLHSPNIKFLGHMSHKEVMEAMSLCRGVIVPSFYESFGLPLLEGLSLCGVVACSNTGALPEIANGAAVLFNPNSIESLMEAIETLESTREELLERSKKWRLDSSFRFSLKKVSLHYLNRYRLLTL
jgi:glycosyltransferase involved in cell wall biosynthesis